MADVDLECPDCQTKLVVGKHFKGFITCPSCGYFAPRSKWKRGAVGKRLDTVKRASDQERRAAKRIGGRTQPASGALPGAKGDVSAEDVRMECKHTTRKSISLKLDWLLKIEREASVDQTPLVEVEFQSVSPYRRYVVLRAEDYEAMRGKQDE